MLVDGISLIPNNGNHTQKIPPITSVRDNNVNSAACIALDPIEYKIRPKHTNTPWGISVFRSYFIFYRI